MHNATGRLVRAALLFWGYHPSPHAIVTYRSFWIGADVMKDQRWCVQSSRYVLSTRWISVRADDCVTASGVEVAPYYIFEAPDLVLVLALDEAGRVVLVRQYRHGLGDLSLELPGGFVDAGETDILATGARELREETGYVGGTMKPLVTLSVDPGRYASRAHFVMAQGVCPGEAAPEDDEDIEVLLVAREEAHRLASTGGIADAGHAAAILIGLASL